MRSPSAALALISVWVVGWACIGAAAAADVGALTLTEFGPEYAVHVARADGSAPMAYITRDADGLVTLEWSYAAPDVTFQAEARAATLAGLPAGVYTVRWWNGQTRAVGKTLLSGVGARQDVTVGALPRHLALAPPAGVFAPTRLNVVWGGPAPPGGVVIAVDDAFVGHAFDSAEASVFGLGKGERRVTVSAAGYRPISFTVVLDARRESTRFVRFQPLSAQ